MLNIPELEPHAQAIRKRRIFLQAIFSRNGQQQERAGLISLQRAIFILATRHVRPPEWPGHVVEKSTELLWEILWYSDYLSALLELIPPLQSAVRSGTITPRGGITRARLQPEQLTCWLELDAAKTIDAAIRDFSLANNALPPMASGWPDSTVYPLSACVTLEQLACWAETGGIASRGEVATLLGEGKYDQGSLLSNEAEPETPAASSGTPVIDEHKAETPSRTTEKYKSSWPTCTKHELIDGFQLTGKNWEDTLSRPSKYDSAKRQPGRRGKGGEAIWCPLTFAGLLVLNEDCTQSQVKTRFLKIKEWKKWESELLAEIGMI